MLVGVWGSQWAVLFLFCLFVTLFALRFRFGRVWVCCVCFVPSPVLRWPPSPLLFYGCCGLRFMIYCVGFISGGCMGERGRPKKDVSERRQRELNARQRAYVVWMATPPLEREIKTLTELQEVLGVSQQAMWKWSKDPRIIEAIRFCSLQNAGSPERVRQILDMVFEQAMEKKDVRYAEIWMKGTGVMGQFGRSADVLEIVDDLEQDTISDLSVEELQRVRDLALAERAEAAAIEIAKRSMSED